MCRIIIIFFFPFQDEVKRTGEPGVEETILEGHIGVTKELLAFQTPEKKFYIGCEKGGASLIKVNSLASFVQFQQQQQKQIFYLQLHYIAVLIDLSFFHQLFIGVNG